MNLLNTASDVTRNDLNNIENVTLWEINCTIYCIALTCKELNNDVRTSEKRKNEPVKWITSTESGINRIDINIPCTSCKKMQTIVYVYKTSKDTPPHDKKEIFNSKMSTLETELTSLKQELKNKADNRRHEKRLIERKKINSSHLIRKKYIII